jgi:hypothetical protein
MRCVLEEDVTFVCIDFEWEFTFMLELELG